MLENSYHVATLDNDAEQIFEASSAFLERVGATTSGRLTRVHEPATSPEDDPPRDSDVSAEDAAWRSIVDNYGDRPEIDEAEVGAAALPTARSRPTRSRSHRLPPTRRTTSARRRRRRSRCPAPRGCSRGSGCSGCRSLVLVAARGGAGSCRPGWV